MIDHALAGPAETSGPRARILVVDDSAEVRGYIARLLRTRYEVETSGDGTAALTAARARRPDLILADVVMPGMDGFELLRELRRDDGLGTVPVLLVSSRADEDARGEGREAGADHYIEKPFSPRELFTHIATHLEMARVRREAAEAARHAERFRAFTQATSDVIYGMSADWRELRFVNGRAIVADTVQPNRNWLETYIPAGDRPDVQAAIERAIRTRSPLELEHRVIRVDGTIGWVATRAIPILDAGGAIVEWFGAANDITRRKDNEERLRADLDAMTRLQLLGWRFVCQDDLEPVFDEIVDVAMAIAAADFGIIQLIDPATGQLRIAAQRGFEPWWLDYWDGAGAGTGAGACGAALRVNERVIVEDVATSPLFIGTPALEIQLRAGIRAVQSTPLVSRSGQPLGVFSTHYRNPHRPDDRSLRLLDLLARQAADIVERGISASALRESEEKLRDADRRKDEFIATLAHELRNPLAPIRTGLELIRLGGNTPSAVERVRGIMERQIGHMVRLIDDLLDMSRITSGKIQLQRHPAQLAEMIDSAVEGVRAFIAERRITLTVHLPDAPTTIDVDRTRFVQVLSNLLHNAAKFTPPDGRIDVSATVLCQNGRTDLSLTVADNGIGIPSALLPRVFDLFSQGDDARAQSQGGLGIGLALVRRLVEIHGGRVEARSEGPGRGTQIVIHLPIGDATALAPPTTIGIDARIAGCRVLVVDGHEDAAKVLAMFVTDLGGDTRIATDGPGALAIAREFNPQVVFVGVGLPGMEGYAACRQLRDAAGSVPVTIVALSSWGHTGDQHLAPDAGFDVQLTKPADLLAIVKILGDAAGAGEDRSLPT